MLIAQGADVLANHSASPAVPQAAEERGVAVISYRSHMSRFAPRTQIAAVTHPWGGCYTEVARSVLEGRWQPQPVWGGMKEGLVQLSAVSPALPVGLRRELAERQQAIASGAFKPFAAPLIDNAGRHRLSSGALGDAQIAAMDWLVQGAVDTLPASR